MARGGYKKFDVLKLEDGRTFAIRVNKESGEFEIDCRPPADPNENHGIRIGTEGLFTGASLEKVKDDAERWLRDHDELAWEPVIVVAKHEQQAWEKAKEHAIQLAYSRYYRGRRPDGTFLWRHVKNQYQQDEPLGAKDSVTDPPWYVKSGVVLPYSESRWQALRTISKMIEALDARIQDVIKDAGKLDQTLGTIAERGFLALLPPKEETRK